MPPLKPFEAEPPRLCCFAAAGSKQIEGAAVRISTACEASDARGAHPRKHRREAVTSQVEQSLRQAGGGRLALAARGDCMDVEGADALSARLAPVRPSFLPRPAVSDRKAGGAAAHPPAGEECRQVRQHEAIGAILHGRYAPPHQQCLQAS